MRSFRRRTAHPRQNIVREARHQHGKVKPGSCRSPVGPRGKLRGKPAQLQILKPRLPSIPALKQLAVMSKAVEWTAAPTSARAQGERKAQAPQEECTEQVGVYSRQRSDRQSHVGTLGTASHAHCHPSKAKLKKRGSVFPRMKMHRAASPRQECPARLENELQVFVADDPQSGAVWSTATS